MLKRNLLVGIALGLGLAGAVVAAAATSDSCRCEGGASAWVDSMQDGLTALVNKAAGTPPRPLPDFGHADFTAAAWVRTTAGGTILCKAPESGRWLPQGKTLFLEEGRVVFDIGWVGCIRSQRRIADGSWHHVGLVCQGGVQRLYVDGHPDATGNLRRQPDPGTWVMKIGRTSENFGGDFRGQLDEVRLFARALSAEEIVALVNGPVGAVPAGLAGSWSWEGDGQDASGGGNYAAMHGATAFAPGRAGKALSLSGGWAVVRSASSDPLASLWARLHTEFPDAVSRQEMGWERQDGIWNGLARPRDWTELARRYAQAARRGSDAAGDMSAKAASVRDRQGMLVLRDAYLTVRRREEFLAAHPACDLASLEAMIRALRDSFGPRYPNSAAQLARLGQLQRQAAELAGKPEELDRWETQVAALRRQALLADNPRVDFDKLLFVKRNTYTSNHYYTEYINSDWTPGGNLCVLDLKDGSVREVVPQLQGGVFERFDLSFDARRVVFAWKAEAQLGYRIYEVNLDGTGLRQLTFPQPDDADLVRKYRVRPHYHHGTDDMQPCYLPDGGIAFISTRCQYGILCDDPDDFTTTVLYRMDGDGKNLQRLSNSSVSEAAPAMLPDGRILYTRWEYVDKGAVSVKCLWAMRPDGTASAEIYGNDIALPPTLIYGRPIPEAANRYVVLGTPHCPQNGVGTVIRLDVTKDIRSRDPMTYMTPYVDIQAEGGFAFRPQDPAADRQAAWQHDGQGRGPLFKDPYPLCAAQFLVAHKPEGPVWNDAKAYGLYLLDEQGRTALIYRDPAISCWLPYPVKPRAVPPVLTSPRDPRLASQKQAVCVVSDVYRGLKDVPRGTIKYIRVLEQVPRPWATRRRWDGDGYDQQHACITKDTHLGLKVQHGVVPVEEDGSAHFLVPAEANVILQALDDHYMAVQTERTFVNYMPGETRSCVGCHETPNQTAGSAPLPIQAMRRGPSLPGPQPGETSGRRALDYAADVQPVWDRHCVSCHNAGKAEGKLDLSGNLTALFNVSYESLVPERRKGHHDRQLLGPVIGENHPKTGNVDYLPARSLGSHASVLVALLSPDHVRLRDPVQAERARKQAAVHAKIRLAPEELVRITNWVDTNCQYYGTYWGRKNLRYRSHPDFRPATTFELATRKTSPAEDDTQ